MSEDSNEPSIHARALLTWIVIFPLVTFANAALDLLPFALHPLLRSLLVSAVVVAIAVYLAVPRLMGWYARRRRR